MLLVVSALCTFDRENWNAQHVLIDPFATDTGGSSSSPTYSNIGDHTEAMLVEYDPTVLTYEDVVRRFFNNHSWSSPCRSSTQYRSCIWYENAEQKAVISTVVSELESESGRKCCTAVEKSTPFYRAEEYHQNYINKQQARWR